MRIPLTMALLAALAAAGCGRNGRSEAGETDAYGVLVEALRSGQPMIQGYAAEAVMEVGASRARPELETLAEAGNPRLRTVALAALGRMRRPEYRTLFRRRATDADPVVRLAAAYGLAMTGDPSQMEWLRDGLASPNVTVRRTAAWLLGLMGNPSAKGLLEVKLDDPDALVVLRAAEALHRLGSTAGRERVRRLTSHPRHTVRAAATRLLGRLGAAEDVPRLEQLALSQRFLDVKLAAIGSLAQLGDLLRITMLLELLDAEVEGKPDVQTRSLAAMELGEAGYAPALEPLGEMLDRPAPLERVTAAAAILKIRTAGSPWRDRIREEEKTDAAGAGKR